MELLVDTDSIIKMGRYSLLVDFESRAVSNGHAKPFRNLYEITGKIARAQSNPKQSDFRTNVAVNMCRSFVQDCKSLDRATDFEILDELREIEGMDQGEALLVEYALRQPQSIIVTGDKRMIRGLMGREATKFRWQLQQRILHIERIIWTLASGANWSQVRDRLCAVPDCDTAIYDAVHAGLTEPDAKAKLYKMMTEFERSSLGLLRAAI